MITDYKKIAEENIKKYGTDIGRYGPVLLAHLYSDRTHFIYEILQNAEDAGAKINKKIWISFHLFKDRLEIRHNGKLFDDADVQGICGLVEGTKKDDLTQIGKFGIGFKSVYAYTNTPKVYSGNEAFCIENYVLPHAIYRVKIPDNETLFIFPFNHDEIHPEQSFKEISARLRDIGIRTLLFLNHIEEISWCIDGQESGTYIRDIKIEKSHKIVYVISKVGEQNVEDEEWLIFERPLKLNVSNETNLKVEAAFKIEKDKNGKELVTPAKDSKLIVFFSTEKPTYLDFLIQGPYKTTPNRENIPLEDEQNKMIVRETSELVAETVSFIKELGYLDVNFLNILPITSAHIEGETIYATIFEKVKAKLLSDEELLPSHNGQYTKASDSLLARSKDLAEILNQDDTETLFSRKNWLSTDITYDRTRELRNYLINELEIKEIEFEDFARNITSEFLEKKSDEWMIRFYGYLLEQRSLWKEKTIQSREGILRTKPIIRLDNNTHIAPYDEDGNIQVYLPVEVKSEYDTVKKTLINNESSLKFLKELGLHEPDLFTEISEKILPKYQKEEKFNEEEYFEDFKKILTFFSETDSTKKKDKLISKLSDTTFILSTSGDLRSPREMYQYTPDLMQYFEGYSSVYFVSEKLYDRFEENGLISFLMEIGIQGVPRRKKFNPNLSYEEKYKLRNSSNITRDVEEYDYDLEGLDNFLSCNLSIKKSCLLWNLILQCIKSLNSWDARSFFEGSYKWQYYSINQKSFDAMFLKTLLEKPWLIDKEGNLRQCSEITFSELHSEYQKDVPNIDVLKEKLRFKPDIIDQLPEDYKKKLALVKERTSKEIEEALALLDKQRAEKEEKEKIEDSWIPEYEPDDIEEIPSEIIVPEPYDSPNLEGQVGKTDSTSGDGKHEKEKTDTKEEPQKVTSKQKKEIGNWGERCILHDLKKRYKRLGVVEDTEYGFCLKDEENKTIEVCWLNIKSESGKGYDFVIKKGGIESEYIEVKTKVRDEEELIEITGTQWEFARKLFNRNEGDKYWIYAVLNAGQNNAKIQKIKNPIKLWREGRLYAHPINFKL